MSGARATARDRQTHSKWPSMARSTLREQFKNYYYPRLEVAAAVAEAGAEAEVAEAEAAAALCRLG